MEYIFKHFYGGGLRDCYMIDGKITNRKNYDKMLESANHVFMYHWDEYPVFGSDDMRVVEYREVEIVTC